MSNSTFKFLDGFPADWPETEYLPLAMGASPSNASATDNYMTLGCALMAPASRGNITIKSADTSDMPVISPNWLQAVEDQEVAVQSLKRIREWAMASGIVMSEYQPGPALQTNEQILAWLKENSALIYHASASCTNPLSCFQLSA